MQAPIHRTSAYVVQNLKSETGQFEMGQIEMDQYAMVQCSRGQTFDVQLARQSFAYRFAAGLLSAVTLTVALTSLYMVKTIAGIDVLEGPSLFHAIFF